MPANRMAVLQRFTLEGVVVISVSMLDRLCNRAEFLCAFAYLNTISRRKRAGTHLQLHCEAPANWRFFSLHPANLHY